MSITIRFGHVPAGYFDLSTLSVHFPAKGSAPRAEGEPIRIAATRRWRRIPSPLERPQEVEDRLLVRLREPGEPFYDRVGFGRAVGPRAEVPGRVVAAVREAAREVVLDGHEQIRSAAVVEEEEPLAEAPERRRAELVRTGVPLEYVV